MNAERCLLAGEALGLGYVALKKAAKYARERIVFGRPIGQNQSIQHPLAAAYMELEAAKLAVYHAARLYDASRTDHSITQHAVGVACNSAKYVAAEAAYTACERSVSLSFLLHSQIFLTTFTRSWHTEAWGRLDCFHTDCHNITNRTRYAQEYHVERYLRECFVPRIAPVSRV